MSQPISYTIHYHPPRYPAKCFPSKCRHEPQFVMQQDVHIVPRKRGGNSIEIDHAVCLACGKAMDCTIGGNILVDLTMLWGRFRFQAEIGARILFLRNRWSRIATYLFDENGWNGRHERIARMIDPNLTMKLKLVPTTGTQTRDSTRLGVIRFDREYLREEIAA